MKVLIIGTAYPYRGGLAAFNERLDCRWQTIGQATGRCRRDKLLDAVHGALFGNYRP